MTEYYCICYVTYNLYVDAEDEDEAIEIAEETIGGDIPEIGGDIPDHVECECEKI